MKTAPVSSANAAAALSVSSTTLPLSSTSAPYSLVAESFGSATPTGMKMVERMPSSRAAKATPCAWFPADAATTPRALSSSLRWTRRLYAPRILYDPVRCRFSHLSQTSEPSTSDSERELSIGVTSMTAPTTARAASNCASVGPGIISWPVPTATDSLTADDILRARAHSAAPGAAHQVRNHDVLHGNQRNREQCARDTGDKSAGRDHEDDGERMQLDRRSRDERMQEVAFEHVH